jgi:acetoin utilization deacetylase AcuC-like enzyme
MHVSTEGFAMLTERVRSVAEDLDAGLGFVLEGGYGLDTLADGIAAVHETFDGREPVEPDGDPDDDTAELIAEMQASHPALA